MENRNWRSEERFLSAQADRFAGAKREEKGSSRAVRNDSGGGWGIMSDLKVRPTKRGRGGRRKAKAKQIPPLLSG
jgi:hypothetical protein